MHRVERAHRDRVGRPISGPLVELTRRELADFVLERGGPARGSEPLAELDRVLDRSRLMPPAMAAPAVLDAKGDLEYSHDLEH